MAAQQPSSQSARPSELQWTITRQVGQGGKAFDMIDGPYCRRVDVVPASVQEDLTTMLKRLLDVALVDGYGETVRDEAEALLARIEAGAS